MGMKRCGVFVDMSLSWRMLPKTTCCYGTLVVLAVFFVFLPRSDACKASKDEPLQLSFGNLTRGNATFDNCKYWVLSNAVVEQEASCSPLSGDAYLFFEFWRLDRNGTSLDSRGVRYLLFLVARGQQPNATLSSGYINLEPTDVEEPQLGQNGTMVDWGGGVASGRPHQRILVPLNATSSNGNDWYVTVANMDTTDVAGTPFVFRVTCVNPTVAPAPCPRSYPAVDVECSGRGTCGEPPTDVLRPSLNRVCYCDSGFGDVDCSTPAPLLDNGGISIATLNPGDWAFWQVSIPTPIRPGEPQYSPTLLVEMARAGGFGADGGYIPQVDGVYGGGDPVLYVMPKGVKDANRLPYFGDYYSSADAVSVRLQQNLHFRLLRDLSYVTTLPRTANANGVKTLEYYVAVYNNPTTLRLPGGLQAMEPKANVTVQVRWKVPGGPVQALCPGNCYSRGSCTDPYDSAAAVTSLKEGPVPPTTEFRCSCSTGYGGPLCEGTMRNLTVSPAGDGSGGLLKPGDWAFFVFQVDPRGFDTLSDDLYVEWKARGNITRYNGLLTANLMAFPRVPQPYLGNETDPFKQRGGLLMSYNTLFEDDGYWKPILIGGQKLKSGYSYVLGLYDSDYVQRGSYNYTLSMYVPRYSRTWLHPYMSVVLGITASIILCLLMTLCRRVLQRYGWGPFRSRATDGPEGPDGNLSRVQVAQMPPRHRGVPAGIIDTFHTYEYKATRAEKAQLAKSRPEPQGPANQQEQQPSEAAAPPPPRPAAVGSIELGQIGSGGGAAAATVPSAAPEGLHEPTLQKPPLGNVPVTAGASASATDGGALMTSGPAGGGNQLMMSAAASAPAPAALAAAAGGASSSSPSGTTAAGGGSSSCESDEDDEPQCAVCLCEYEEGESITQLPCRHEFHGTCIRKWLQTHYTCPICRVSLLPDAPEPPEPPGRSGGAPAADPQLQPPQPLQELPMIQQPQQLQAGEQGVVGMAPPHTGGGNAPGSAAVIIPMVTLWPPQEQPQQPQQPQPQQQQQPSPQPQAADPPPRQSFLSRFMDSMRMSSPRHSGAIQPMMQAQQNDSLPPPPSPPAPQQQQQTQLQSQRSSGGSWMASAAADAGGAAGAGAVGAAPSEPAQAALLATPTAYTGASYVATSPPPGSPQLLARGPTAVLESPVRSSRSGGGGGGAAAPPVSVGPSSPPTSSRLAAGRLSAAAAAPMHLGVDGGAAGGGDGRVPSPSPQRWGSGASAGGARLRDSAVLTLPPQMVDEEPGFESRAGRN